MPSIAQETSTDLNVSLLLSTFLQLEKDADGFATTFYRILFEKYPSVKPLFEKTDMKKQRKKLIESLQLVIANVHSTDTISRILRELGKKHVNYGATLRDYPLVGDALLQALEHHLRESWTPEAAKTWTAAYQMIAGLMAEGARSMDPEPAVVESMGSHEPNESKTVGRDSNQFRFDKLLVAFATFATVVMVGYGFWIMNQGSPQPASTEQNSKQ